MVQLLDSRSAVIQRLFDWWYSLVRCAAYLPAIPALPATLCCLLYIKCLVVNILCSVFCVSNIMYSEHISYILNIRSSEVNTFYSVYMKTIIVSICICFALFVFVIKYRYIVVFLYSKCVVVNTFYSVFINTIMVDNEYWYLQ